MRVLAVGEPVRVTAEIPSFWHCMGRIIQIVEPFVSTEQTKARAFFEMPLYFVKLDDGRKFRFRGRDLESLTTLSRMSVR